jgi:hypothetical protein
MAEYNIYSNLNEILTFVNLKNNTPVQKNNDIVKNINDDSLLANTKLNLTMVYAQDIQSLKIIQSNIDINDLKSNIDRLISNAKLFVNKLSSRSNFVINDELSNLKKDDVNILKAVNYEKITRDKFFELKVEINEEKLAIFYHGLQNDIANAQKDAEKLLNEVKFIKFEFDLMKLKFLELNKKFISEWILANSLDCIIDCNSNMLVIYSTNVENIEKCYEMINNEIIIKKHSLTDDNKSKIKEYLIHLLSASVNNNEIVETILFQHYLVKQVNSKEFFICGFKNETRKAYFESQKCDAVYLPSLDI